MAKKFRGLNTLPATHNMLPLHSFKRQAKRVLIAITGSAVMLVGVILIPYPGPGWLIVFGGLAILATEFEWARRLRRRVRQRYERWHAWANGLPLFYRGAILLGAGSTVVFTFWLLDGFSIVDSVLDLHTPWLHSPLPFFSLVL